MIDFNSEFGQRVARRLREERIIWLTTLDAQLIPQPRPVWFLWNGEDFLIYSRPDTAKLRHIARHPQVSLNLDSDGLGGDIMIFGGLAEIADDAPAADKAPEYLEKYADGLKRIGMSAEQFAREYSAVVRVKPLKLRGH